MALSLLFFHFLNLFPQVQQLLKLPLPSIQFEARNVFFFSSKRRSFDRILCGAQCPQEKLPLLCAFLKVHGILIVPCSTSLLRIQRDSEDSFSTRQMASVQFKALVLPASGAPTEDDISLVCFCEKGHLLECGPRDVDGGWSCDACHSHYTGGTSSMHCLSCDYDNCFSCARHRQVTVADFQETLAQDNVDGLRSLPLVLLDDVSLGYGLLHCCSSCSALKCASWLLDRGANVDVRNRYGLLLLIAFFLISFFLV
jgi:hypothetical protein